jgi:excisionase family DNA binding protein
MLSPATASAKRYGGFMTERVYTTVDLAKVCKVSLRTAIRWVDEGKLTSFRTPGGHRRVREADLLKFLDRYQIPFSVKPSAEKKRILVVETKRLLEGLLRQILRRSSDTHEIVVAKDLYESGVKIGLLQPDLVIFGTIPKGQEIVKFCRSLRKIPETKSTKIIVLSEKIAGNRMQELLSLGVQAVIDKPYTIEDLRPHLLRLLGDPSRPAQ